MKILHINFVDNIGGAAIAASRLNEAMNRVGLDSTLLVIEKNSKEQSTKITTIYANRYRAFVLARFLNKIQICFLSFFKPRTTFSLQYWGVNLKHHPLVMKADVIYLHWINGAMLSIRGVESIVKLGKPVYWFMHDMYPLTGGCHHSYHCTKYQTKCKECPFMERFVGMDIVRMQFNSKMRAWSIYENFNIQTPSKWLAECARSSAIFQGHEVKVCHNVIDTEKYKPLDKMVAKKLFGLSLNKKIIMFIAQDVKNEYKGWKYLREALNKLDKDDYECLILGTKNVNIDSEVTVQSIFTGYLQDDYSLIMAYNAADLLVTPSLADNFPNVLLEAMACSIPCVGFNVGGIPELIRHKETGYLAILKDSQDLADGINWVLNNGEYKTLAKNARRLVVDSCSYNVIMNIHKELVERLK